MGSGNDLDKDNNGNRDPRWQRRPNERRREIIQAAAGTNNILVMTCDGDEITLG